MPSRLKRYYGQKDLHFVTLSCYGHRPLRNTASARDTFIKVLDVMRQHPQFLRVGYIVRPDHVHLLISEPARLSPSVALKALKHRASVDLRELGKVHSPFCPLYSASKERILPRFW